MFSSNYQLARIQLNNFLQVWIMNKNVYILFFVTVEQRIRTLTQRNARHEKYDVSMLLDPSFFKNNQTHKYFIKNN